MSKESLADTRTVCELSCPCWSGYCVEPCVGEQRTVTSRTPDHLPPSKPLKVDYSNYRDPEF